MSKHLQRDFDHIHSELLSLFGYVEQMIDFAVQALCQRRSELVTKVLEMDEHVDLTEVFIKKKGSKFSLFIIQLQVICDASVSC